MTSKVIEGHKSVSNFSFNPTLPSKFIYESNLIKKNICKLILWISPSYWMVHWCFALQIVWISLSFFLPLSLSKSSPLIALNANLWKFSSLLIYKVLGVLYIEKLRFPSFTSFIFVCSSLILSIYPRKLSHSKIPYFSF